MNVSLPIYGYFFRNAHKCSEQMCAEAKHIMRALNKIDCASTDSVHDDKGGWGRKMKLPISTCIRLMDISELVWFFCPEGTQCHIYHN